MSKKEQPETKALTPYDSIVGATMDRIGALQKDGQIHFPKDYSPQNALQSAWLMLQETTNKDHQPVLGNCTPASIASSLLDMVISGLNPAKKQGYFIAYGKRLAWSQSYFGAMALAKRVDPRIAEDGIIAEIIYEDDEFAYEIVKGRRMISKHTQKFENMDTDSIEGAYCLVIDTNGEIITTEVMTFEEIKKSWGKSQMNPIDGNGDVKPGSNHGKQPVEFCKRTIINRTCKPIINSSSDKVLLASVNRSEIVQAETDAAKQIEEHANQGDVVDAEFDEEKAKKEWIPEDEEVAERMRQTAERLAERLNAEKAQTVEERKASGAPTTFEPKDKDDKEDEGLPKREF